MTYLIAELGQNHNGSLAIALEMVDMVARPYDAANRRVLPYAWDAVKTCKRDVANELTPSAASEPYTGRNSFGATYGAHRAALELSWAEHAAIRDRAKSYGLDFVVTICAPTLVDSCPFRPDSWKVASRDLTNGPLLEAIAGTDIPVIISTGMHGRSDLEAALRILHGKDVTVLHCISEYPAQPDRLNLRTIPHIWCYGHRVGFSDHTVGLLAGPLAVALGAEVLEKHVSLYRGMRGTDQPGALGPEGVWRYVRDVRLAKAMLGESDIESKPTDARLKLERSIAASSDLSEHTLVGSSNTVTLSPGTGVTWPNRKDLFGKYTTRRVRGHEHIRLDDVA